MIAIRTRYHGPTDSTGSRIVATTYANGRRQSVRAPYPHELASGVPAHWPAAEALAERLGLVLTAFAEEPAASPRGYVFMATRKPEPGTVVFPVHDFVAAVWSDCRLPGGMRKDLEALYHNGVIPALRANGFLPEAGR